MDRRQAAIAAGEAIVELDARSQAVGVDVDEVDAGHRQQFGNLLDRELGLAAGDELADQAQKSADRAKAQADNLRQAAKDL